MPLTLQDVLAHQASVAWPQLHQVEQDLLLSLAMNAIFEDKFLHGQVAMRGGTVLHKVHLAPAARYSEDIDLVVVGDRPDDHIERAIKRVLRLLFGREKSSAWETLRLAVRNATKPSRILRCIYKIDCVSNPGQQLTVEVETNVTERTPKFELPAMPFAFQHRGREINTSIISYQINEMLGTKMRALFQRKKGRDLFDLYWALTARSVTPVSAAEMVDAFMHYMRDEDTYVPRSEFQAHLHECLADKVGFCGDIRPLLRAQVAYDPQQAGRYVEQHVISLLPERPQKRG